MRQTVLRLRNLVFGALIAGALGTGASATLAAPRDASACFDPDAACVTPVECVAYCFPRGGRCSNGCCACNR